MVARRNRSRHIPAISWRKSRSTWSQWRVRVPLCASRNFLQPIIRVSEHYYLGTIGVEPAVMYGERASRPHLWLPVLERCDAGGIPAYLECSSEGNVIFYSGLGFVVTEQLRAPGGGPPIWLMWRDPYASHLIEEL